MRSYIEITSKREQLQQEIFRLEDSLKNTMLTFQQRFAREMVIKELQSIIKALDWMQNKRDVIL